MEINSPLDNMLEDQDNDDLLIFYRNSFSYRLEDIKLWTRGIRYSAVMLNNGNIGVCANQNCGELNSSPPPDDRLDLLKLSHRVWFQAYINAILNYNYHYQLRTDITQSVNFAKYNFVVMIGLFKPILEKLMKNQVKVKVYDLKFSKIKINYHQSLDNDLKKTAGVILTATSITNRSFNEILRKTNQAADFFILGPSTILSPTMFEINRIKGLFGMIFKQHDQEVLDIIRQGGGTRNFVKIAEKVGRLSTA